MDVKLTFLEKPKLKNPVLVEGLPGVGGVGRIALCYIVEKLKAKKFAEITSSYFFPLVLISQDHEITPLKLEFFYYKAAGRDIIFVYGDSQPVENNGYFQICEKILEMCKEYKVKEIITVGGFGTGIEMEKPRVLGAVTDKKLVKKYEPHGIIFEEKSKIGSIYGISGLLLGISKNEGIEGCALLGETIGYPILTDPKAAEEVVKVLMSLLKVKVDLKAMDKSVKQLEGFLKELEDKTKHLTGHPQKTAREYADYIG
ncbi:MAG: PAC2 family protein [Candidatus Aenigmarchaeota archaeon]|nr:PAC2 family protein [Candidatus Aenigmarchaeota archaeon]